MNSLQNKVAMVTGGSHRVGREIALALARAGANVVVHHFEHVADAAQTAADIRTMGRETLIVEGNMMKWDDAARVGCEALAHFGKVDVLINSASSFIPHGFFEITENDVDVELGVHVKGVVALSQVIGKAMLQRSADEGYANIINIVDLGAFLVDRGYVMHNIGKAALESLTHHMLIALAPKVRVNSICPGPILKPPTGYEETWESLRKTNPQHEIGSPQQIIEAILFLLTGPTFVNGVCLRVDGGTYWYRPNVH